LDADARVNVSFEEAIDVLVCPVKIERVEKSE